MSSRKPSNFQYHNYQQKRQRERKRVGAAIDTGSLHDAYVGYVQLANIEHQLASVCAEREQSRHLQRSERYRKAAAVLVQVINSESPGVDPEALFESAATVAREVDDRASATDRLAKILLAYSSSLTDGTPDNRGASPSPGEPSESTSGTDTDGATAGAARGGGGTAGHQQNREDDGTRSESFDVDAVDEDLVQFKSELPVTMDDIGGYQEIKDLLWEEVVEPIEQRELYEEYDITPNSGVMLVGPPGCGKTLMVKALCGSAGWAFGRVDCADATSALFGKSAKRLTTIFDQAKESASEQPTVLFFDEIDTLVPARDQQLGGSSGTNQLVTTFLTQMNDLSDDDRDLVVIGASNAPDMVDSAVIDNKQRMSEVIEVGLPDEDAREEIFRVHLDECPTDEDALDYPALAAATEGFSGSEIEVAVRKAAKAAIRASKNGQAVPLDQQRVLDAIEAVESQASGDDSHL